MKQIKLSSQIHAENQELKPKQKKSTFQKIKPLLFFLVGLFLFFLVVNFLFKSNGDFSFSFGQILRPKDSQVNVLLLGNGGGR